MQKRKDKMDKQYFNELNYGAEKGLLTLDQANRLIAELKDKLSRRNMQIANLNKELKEVISNGNNIMLQDKSNKDYLVGVYQKALSDVGVNPYSRDFRIKYFNTKE